MSNNTKQVTFGEEAKVKLMRGVTILTDAVTSTLGPSGRTVIIEPEYNVPHVTKDGVTVAKHITLADPIENLGAQIIKQAAATTAQVAGDGPQPLYAKVLTPNGFVTIGNLNKGDIICGTNGTTQTIEETYEKGEKEIYKVYFSNGRVVECCEDHLWTIVTERGLRKTLPLKDIIPAHKNRSVFIPNTAVEFNTKNVAIDPYLVGLLIGDGSLSGTGRIELSLGLAKEHVLSKIEPTLIESVKWVEDKNYFRVVLSSSLQEPLKELGLHGTNSKTKFIPKDYLYNNVIVRSGLLQGLLDTDGYINKRGNFEFSTVSDQLKDDFLELAYSLGYSVHHKLHVRDLDIDSYSNTPIHRITQLKGYKRGNKIVSIEKTDTLTQMRCIKVSNPDNLYITDGYIATHNTTTATLLAYELLREGSLLKADPNTIKRSFEKLAAETINKVKAVSKEVTLDNIRHIASISANNDTKIGDLIKQGYDFVGLDGILTLEDSKSGHTSVSTVEGANIPTMTYLSPYFLTDKVKREVVYENPVFLITDKKIRANVEVVTALEISQRLKRPLVIIADELEAQALALLVVNRIHNMFPVVALRAPAYAERRAQILEDLCTLTGATLISNIASKRLEDVTEADLGSAKKIVVTDEGSLLLQTGGEKKKIEDRIEELTGQLTDPMNTTYLTNKIMERIAFLKGKIAVISVGAATETEALEVKYRVDDALRAVTSAIKEGYVEGGGMTLLRIASEMETNDSIEEAFQRVLKAPFNKILENADLDPIEVIKQLSKVQQANPDEPFGFNAATHRIENLFDSGVIDPTLVVTESLKNAASAAGMLLLTNATVHRLKREVYEPERLDGEFE